MNFNHLELAHLVKQTALMEGITLPNWKERRQLCDYSVGASRKMSGLVSDQLRTGLHHETVKKKKKDPYEQTLYDNTMCLFER